MENLGPVELRFNTKSSASPCIASIIIAENFNLHHSVWNPLNYSKHDPEADKVIQLMTQLRLKLIILTDIITFLSVSIAIDLIWDNNRVKQEIIKCEVLELSDHESNHLFIEIILRNSEK